MRALAVPIAPERRVDHARHGIRRESSPASRSAHPSPAPARDRRPALSRWRIGTRPGAIMPIVPLVSATTMLCIGTT